MPRNAARTGQVKWLDASKGSGFISPADGSKDVFVHLKDIQGSGVHNGRYVQFEVIQNGGKGLVAVNVRTV